MNRIEIIDRICGSGKTHAIIDWMKRNPIQRYLYVSPMLTEVEERIPSQAEWLNFKFPEVSGEYATKGDSLMALLREGHNIAFTHSLYLSFTRQHINTIREMGYILVVDEEVNLIQPLDSEYTSEDIRYLHKDGKLAIDKDKFGQLKWTWADYGSNARYSKLKNLCDLGMIYCVESPIDGELANLVIQLPVELVTASSRCIAISYLFKGSVMESFLKMRGIEVVDFDHEAGGVSFRYSNEEVIEKLKGLITFIETPSTKKIGRKSLSYTWYAKEMKQEDADELAAAIRSVAQKVGAISDDVMYTMPKNRAFPERKNAIVVKPKSLPADRCYVYCSARATNDFAHKHTLIHALYRHPNVTIASYLKHYGYPVDIDQFALAEMIQWIFRSRLRNQEPINLCLLSHRMRVLFNGWLESALRLRPDAK